MQKSIVALAGLLLAAPFLSAAEPSSSRFYLMPSAEYMFTGNLKVKDGLIYPYQNLKFKDAAGVSLEGGFYLTENHILKIETGYFETENESANYLATNSYYAPTKVKLEIVPILIGYKYQQKINDKWLFHVGVSEGMSMLRTKITEHFLGDTIPIYGGVMVLLPQTYSFNHTDYVFTFGGEAGLEYKVSERSTLNLGLKCRALGSTDTTTHGVTTTMSLGYKLRF